ncbi:MAG: hypothetical protein AAF289_00160 [Cyanobacteria bacterium P01_A01_bin.135]
MARPAKPALVVFYDTVDSSESLEAAALKHSQLNCSTQRHD